MSVALRKFRQMEGKKGKEITPKVTIYLHVILLR